MDFPDGLVVIWADNSMGKSTCVKSILVALGMEAMLTTSKSELPLPPAVQTRLESDDGEHLVLESEVFLEIENKNGDRIVVQRTIKGTRDKNLITVHLGPILSQPGHVARTADYFVNRAGAATRESGFHHYLASFLGWDLPTVQTYDGGENLLYLQCIFPYFVVEQTRGWSSVQPPLPTQFRIKDTHKRAVEFLLNLDAHRVALKRQELQYKKGIVENNWTTQYRRAADLADQIAASLQGLPQRPVAIWPPQSPPILLVPIDEQWVSLDERIRQNEQKWQMLVSSEIPRVQEIASAAQDELQQAEADVREKQTLLHRLMDEFDMEQSEVSRIQERLAAVEEDIQRNQDVKLLQTLGSRQSSAIDKSTCPVCHQSIHDSLVPLEADQRVMSADESIEFLKEQRTTFRAVLSNSQAIVEARERHMRALREEVSSLRDRVRSLKQTLISDGRLPSQAAIRERVELEADLRADRNHAERFRHIVEEFDDLSDKWNKVIGEIDALPKEDVTASDIEKLSIWTSLLQNQLQQFGFKSFPEYQVRISQDTYRPEQEGFDIESNFRLQDSISASDLIRTIWSYLNGLLEISRNQDTNHPGTILFDEPRQQSTKDMSFRELLRRGSKTESHGQQAIFFTSESIDRLREHLSGTSHKLRQINGRVLQKLPK